jgi:alkylation response protein AidB-like acyl-CoA dehydrogenase
MNFDLTPDQEMLQQSVQRLLADTYDFEQRKIHLLSSRGWSTELWRQFADMGLLGLPFAADDGGFGGGAVDIMLTMESLGRALSLEPYFGAVILAGTALKLGADANQRGRWLPALIEGRELYAFAHVERRARYDLAHVGTRARRVGDRWYLSGGKDFVVHGDSADKIIISARHAGSDADRDGVSLFVVDGAAVRRRAYRTQDGTRAADLLFNDVDVSEGDRIGQAGGALALIDAVVDTGIAALAAEAVGVMERAHQITVDFMKIRKQFGTTIGTFQALQHRAVDMLVMIEQARSMAMYAGMMCEQADPAQRRQAVAAAKFFIGRAGKFVGEQAVQLHGGIGITEECAVGHYFRRLTMIDVLFGDSAHHLTQVALGGALP